MNEKHGCADEPLRSALMQILDEAMKVDDATCGEIRLHNAADDVLELCVHRGFSDGFAQSFAAVARDDELGCARAFRLGRRVSVPDVMRDPGSQALAPVAQREGFRGMQTTPIVAGDGRVVGTLTTHFPKVHAPSSAAGIVLDYCATRVASALAGKGNDR